MNFLFNIYCLFFSVYSYWHDVFLVLTLFLMFVLLPVLSHPQMYKQQLVSVLLPVLSHPQMYKQQLRLACVDSILM